MTDTGIDADATDLGYIQRMALADPDTTLGKLQRGRGAGWLECLELPRSEANDLLWQCIVFDPRVDQQIERREGYYASLARETEFDPARLAPGSVPAPEPWRDQRLIIEVLGELDRAGVTGAGAALLEHLGPEDSSWDFVVPEVLEASDTTFEAFPAALAERRDDEQLAYTIDRWSDDFPWERWARSIPRIAMALRVASHEDSSTPGQRQESEPPGMTADLADLMAYRWWGWRLPDELVTRLTDDRRPGEYEELVQACWALEVPTVPFGILGRLNDPAGIDAALSILDSDVIGMGRGAANRYFAALGPEHTLPLARRWVGTSRQWLAISILGRHGEAEDLPAIRTCLADSWASRSIYPLCHAIDALHRLAEHGPFEELREVYEGVEYSYARWRAAGAIAASDPDSFVTHYARECLWDCEHDTAELGVKLIREPDRDAARRIALIKAGRTGRRHIRFGRLTQRETSALEPGD